MLELLFPYINRANGWYCTRQKLCTVMLCSKDTAKKFGPNVILCYRMIRKTYTRDSAKDKRRSGGCYSLINQVDGWHRSEAVQRYIVVKKVPQLPRLPVTSLDHFPSSIRPTTVYTRQGQTHKLHTCIAATSSGHA